MRQRLASSGIVIVVASLLAACGGGGSENKGSTSGSAAQGSGSSTGGGNAGGSGTAGSASNGSSSGGGNAGGAGTGGANAGGGGTGGSNAGGASAGGGNAGGANAGGSNAGGGVVGSSGAGGNSSGAGGNSSGAGGNSSGAGGNSSGAGGGGGAPGCADGDTQACYSGDPTTKGVGACTEGVSTCNGGVFGPCVGDVTPSAEQCNGVDDDCDGETDELGTQTCGQGACQVTTDVCQNGQPVVCVPLPPKPEACNGIDDSCDGQIDEGCQCLDGSKQPCYSGPNGTQGVGPCVGGTQTCANGQWGACAGEVTPASETCNGTDDDCNGKVDDGDPGGGVACSTGMPGVCGPGTTACSSGQIVCNQNVQPSAETCNGIDEDCDGAIDDGNPGGGQNCATGMQGACAAGKTACNGGQIECQQSVQAQPESCNGVDDDCDGSTDEGLPNLTCGQGACTNTVPSCINGNPNICVPNQPTNEQCNGIDDDCDGVVDDGNPGGNQPCSTGQPGICDAGTTSCQNGLLVCNQNVQPKAETCNGLDDNCDGAIDEGNPGGGASCNTGKLGVCATGVIMCTNGALSCQQTVFPTKEICANGKDDDCNGQTDESVDMDGDGWGTCTGDCCDSPGPCSATPNLVNPGAYEVLNNQVDDDCDGSTSDSVPPAVCTPPPLQTPTTGVKLAQAIDLCQFTVQNPPLAQKKWGVISATLTSADGQAAPPQDIQQGVLANYGPNVVPKLGTTMGSLSSGTARDQGDAGWVQPNGGWQNGNSGNPPPVYLAAHGGVLQTKQGCPAGSGAYDSSNLKIKIRVPTNAKSFSYYLKFYSSEYPEWVCTSYNDFFLALLTSQAQGIPADHNISFDANNNPISVNVGFFQVCQGCPAGTNELVGTGMGGNNGALNDGGGTKWLQTTSPIKPGEDMTIEFIIFDTSDHAWDSLILLDNWQWDLNPAQVGTIIKG